MRYYKITAIWTCDHCGLEENTGEKAMANRWGYKEQEIQYAPDGWISRRGTETDVHYHNEDCLVASMTAEEREEYKKGRWVA